MDPAVNPPAAPAAPVAPPPVATSPLGVPVQQPYAPAPGAAPAAPVAPAAPPAPPAAAADDDPDEPAAPVVGRGGAPMDPEAIAERTKRERKKLLKAEYGTDDPAQIEQIKAKRQADAEELARLKKAEEDRKLSEMTEIDRLKLQLAQKDEEIAKLKAERDEAQRASTAQKQHQQISAMMTKHGFREKFQPFVSDALATHFKSLTKTEQGKFGQVQLNAWLAKYARENPELCAVAPAPTPAAGEPAPAAPAAPATPAAPVRKPAGSGRAAPVPPKAAATPPAAPDPLAGKTPRPGLPNSMNDKELREHMARQGMRKTW